MGLFGFLFKKTKSEEKINTEARCGKYVEVYRSIEIVNDSIEILDTTDNLDTFFSKWDVINKNLQILLEGDSQGAAKEISVICENIEAGKSSGFRGILSRSYERVISDVEKMKTEKGKINKLNKYLAQLSQYEDSYKECGYNDFSDVIKKVAIFKVNLKSKKDNASQKQLDNNTKIELGKLIDIIRDDWRDEYQEDFNSAVKYVGQRGNKPETVTELEEYFIKALIINLRKAKCPVINCLRIERMSGKVLNFMYFKSCQIGRICIGKKGCSIQILTTDKCEWIDDVNIMESISKIEYWIEYVKELIKRRECL